MSFKLLAIRPLPGTHKDFLKNLKPGVIYKFYQDYEFLDENGNDISQYTDSYEDEQSGNWFYCKEKDSKTVIPCDINVLPKPKEASVPNDLYSIKGGPSINISAIVGKNGSGKSALIEMFYYLIYITSTKLQIDDRNRPILNPNDNDLEYKIKQLEEDLKIINEIEETYQKSNLKRFNEVINNLETINSLKKIALRNEITISNEKPTKRIYNLSYLKIQLLIRSNKLSDRKTEVRKRYEFIENNFSCSVIYEIDKAYYELRYLNKNVELKKYDETSQCFIDSIKDLDNHFYSISLNFSHHGLNSLILGEWINKLFHKNDAYQTPLVINPMRDKGNIDINKEIHLSKERIFMNIIKDVFSNKNYKLFDKYKVKAFEFSLKKGITPIKDFIYSSFEKQHNEIRKFPFKLNNPLDKYSYVDYAIGYIQNKINKLQKYSMDFLVNDESIKNESDLKQKLDENIRLIIKEDKSHITKKIYQTDNFIRNYDKEIWGENFVGQEVYNPIVIEVNKLKKWVEKCNPEYSNLDPFELSILAHPGLFNVDFILEDLDGKELHFWELSSGEQQLLFNINTIIYHVHNLNSTFKKNSNSKDNFKRPKFRNVNVFLDEIELYYHPDFQRKFIQNLIPSLEIFKNFNFNILFSTHSPFILSDIPSQNILKLDNGIPVPDKNGNNSFAANIHDLLNDEFFLENGTMGAFAESRIKELIHFYHRVSLLDFETDLEKKIEEQNKLLNEYQVKKNVFEFLVNNVGEPVYQSILQDNLKVIILKMKKIIN